MTSAAMLQPASWDYPQCQTKAVELPDGAVGGRIEASGDC